MSATFVALFVAALAIWFLIRVVDVLLLLFLAALLAVYLSSLTDYLERRLRMRRWVGLMIACAGTFIIVAGRAAPVFSPVAGLMPARGSGLPPSPSHAQNGMAHSAPPHPLPRPPEP